jgi:hypothetical protein
VIQATDWGTGEPWSHSTGNYWSAFCHHKFLPIFYNGIWMKCICFLCVLFSQGNYFNSHPIAMYINSASLLNAERMLSLLTIHHCVEALPRWASPWLVII